MKTDHLPHSTLHEPNRSRQLKHKHSRYSEFSNQGDNGDRTGSDEEVIYLQESPKFEEVLKDYDWETDFKFKKKLI